MDGRAFEPGCDRRSFLTGLGAGAVGIGLASAVRGAHGEEPAAEGLVKRRVLGRTKASISVVTFGGGNLRPDRASILKAAYDHGVTSIDVAWGYGEGEAERAVGTFLKGFPHRDKLFLSTKASGFRPPRGTAAEIATAFEAQVRESLGRLGTDYVDLLMWPHGAEDVGFLKDEAMRDALRSLKEKGLVRFFGFSSHKNYKAVVEAGIRDGFYDAVLTVLNACTQNVEKAGMGGRSIEDTRGLLALAREKDVGVLAMKVAKDGFLGPGAEALLAEAFPEPGSLSRHQRLYAYGLKQEGVTTVLAGIGNVDHLREAVAVGAAA